MFRAIIATAIIASALSTTSINTAAASDGGGGGDPTFITMTNPNGSTVTSRYGRKKSRITTTSNRHGKKVKVVRHKKKFRNRAGQRRSRPWAHNHTTGVTSVGIRPGIRVVIGRGLGIQLSF